MWRRQVGRDGPYFDLERAPSSAKNSLSWASGAIHRIFKNTDMQIDFFEEMNPQSFILNNDGPWNSSACVFPTQFLDQYARCCALGRKTLEMTFFLVVLSIFRPKDRKKYIYMAENRDSAATLH